MSNVEKKSKKEKPAPYSTITGTVGSFISDGFAEITSVGEEFREAYDNAPDSLKGTSVNEARDSTASTIEGFSEPDVSNAILGELDCSCQIDNGKVYRGRQTQSRACRANNGAAQLRTAADALRAWLDENDEIPEVGKERDDRLKELKDAGIDPDEYTQAREEVDSLADACEEIADEAEGLDYPGMFG